jgi:hypothetical protein
MDLRGIDKLMEVLEKAAGRSGGSPPTIVDGKRGVWRTVRGYRMFLELNGKTLGRVLIGPPAFSGKSLNDIGEAVWSELTPEATKKKFSNVDVKPGGIDRLKAAIAESIGPQDTRREHLKGVSTVEQLVPLARSAGFRDADIAAALGGTSAVGAKKLPDRLTRNRTPNIERKPASAPPGAEFKSLIDAFSAPSAAGRGERAKEIAQKIIEDAKKQDDTSTRLRLESVGYALASGALSITQAREKVRDILENQSRNTPVPKKQEVAALHDRMELQNFLDAHETKVDQIAESKVREASGDTQRAKDLAMIDLIEQLETKVQVTEVKTELVKIRTAIESKRMTRQMGIRKLLQLLRLLLSLIPGV